ncbi:c6 zinc finger domain-containing protein [Coniochaeta sp. 2T2.1]|nr:c6 zinc finger domain-containing protein [Coniochaeta sp. 2T2.1]
MEELTSRPLRSAKIGHKKSRNGCKKCKGRRVKEDVDMPESKERRLLEHRLMQNYIQHVAQPFPPSPNREWHDLFSNIIPKLALSHDNMLYSLLTVSASRLLLDDPDDRALYSARQRYLILAMREQRNMIERLSAETADAVCFTSLLLLLNSFSMLRDRILEPYTPPLEYLHIGRGAGTVIWLSVEAATKSGDFEKSNMYVVAKSYPRFGEDESYFSPEMRKDFEGILTQALPSGETWDDATREAYEKTLSYVGSIHHAIRIGEPRYAVGRRIQAFSLLMPSKFISFLEGQRPRALVVLAHFFAAVVQMHDIWWLGEDKDGRESTAKREIRAISKVVQDTCPAWQPLLVYPLDMVGLR